MKRRKKRRKNPANDKDSMIHAVSAFVSGTTGFYLHGTDFMKALIPNQFFRAIVFVVPVVIATQVKSKTIRTAAVAMSVGAGVSAFTEGHGSFGYGAPLSK